MALQSSLVQPGWSGMPLIMDLTPGLICSVQITLVPSRPFISNVPFL